MIKRRTKELGLFNILGMEKRHLAKIMFWETVFSALICLGLGLMGGLVFTRLMFLLLLKLISFEVVLTFQFSPGASADLPAVFRPYLPCIAPL